MKKVIAFILVLLSLFFLVSCNGEKSVISNVKEFDLSAYDLTAPIPFEIVMESGERMEGELYYDIAPITVANFISLANLGYYDGVTFHRVIDNTLIQGGEGSSLDYSIRGEFMKNGWNNTLKHNRGVLSMARYIDDFNSADSQFFICLTTLPALDGEFASFGAITSGIPVADSIGDSEGENEIPVTKQVIAKINILGK